MSNLLSYTNILNDRKNYLKSGTHFGDNFNVLDTPSQKYFKILFYFGSKPEFYSPSDHSGLLAPTWEIYNRKNEIEARANDSSLSAEERTQMRELANALSTMQYYNFNSAWSFLKLNGENERAEKLEHFVTLLSDISSKSPWYFSSISGVQEALERKFTEDGKLDMTERKKITISCLPDSFDNRIGTLLELYRDTTWSWTHKKEIIPANLRKFDMAIYIFETPEYNWHNNSLMDTNDKSMFNVGYKMIEFHDCEFNYNSVKSAWTTLDNQTGVQPTYQIDINYNDCYEVSYNDVMMRTIGDVILIDLVNDSLNDNDYISNAQVDEKSFVDELNVRISPNYDENPIITLSTEELKKSLPGHENSSITDDLSNTVDSLKSKLMPNMITTFGNLEKRKGKQSDDVNVEYKIDYEAGFIGNAIGQAVGHAKQWVKSKINRAVMGNLYTFSLTQMRDQARDLLNGNLIKTGMSIAEYVREANARKEEKNKPKPNGDIFPEPNKSTPLTPRNLYSGSTIANNL